MKLRGKDGSHPFDAITFSKIEMICCIVESIPCIWTIENISKHLKGSSCFILISHSAFYIVEAEYKIVTDFNSVNF